MQRVLAIILLCWGSSVCAQIQERVRLTDGLGASEDAYILKPGEVRLGTGIGTINQYELFRFVDQTSYRSLRSTTNYTGELRASAGIIPRIQIDASARLGRSRVRFPGGTQFFLNFLRWKTQINGNFVKGSEQLPSVTGFFRYGEISFPDIRGPVPTRAFGVQLSKTFLGSNMGTANLYFQDGSFYFDYKLVRFEENMAIFAELSGSTVENSQENFFVYRVGGQSAILPWLFLDINFSYGKTKGLPGSSDQDFRESREGVSLGLTFILNKN